MLNAPGTDNPGTSVLTQWESPATGKRGTSILLLSILLHLLAYMAWPKRAPLDAGADLGKSNTFAIFVTVPQLPEPVPAVQMPAPSIARRPGLSKYSPANSAPAPQAESPTPGMTPLAMEPVHTNNDHSSVQDLAGTAKLAAGKLDRDMRNTGPRPAPTVPVFQGSRLEQGIAAAYVDRSPPKWEELVLDDGRRVTRIGKHCYGKDSPLYTRGIDQIKHGAQTFALKCWQLGVGGKPGQGK
jgi:hypothetical protein